MVAVVIGHSYKTYWPKQLNPLKKLLSHGFMLPFPAFSLPYWATLDVDARAISQHRWANAISCEQWGTKANLSSCLCRNLFFCPLVGTWAPSLKSWKRCIYTYKYIYIQWEYIYINFIHKWICIYIYKYGIDMQLEWLFVIAIKINRMIVTPIYKVKSPQLPICFRSSRRVPMSLHVWPPCGTLRTLTLPPISMEVENWCLEDEVRLQRGHFPNLLFRWIVGNY